MSRLRRLTFNNAILHVFNRGNAKREIFHKDQDFEHFLYILAHYKALYGFKLYHMCLIPNHFHLEPEFTDAQILSQAMHDITQTYTNYHHQEYQTIGHLWQGRYKNMLVEKGEYHQKLGSYIERNAVRAGLVEDPGDWKWSSFRYYGYGELMRLLITIDGNKKWVDLIDEDPLYRQFGATPEERQRNYREFVLEMIDDKVGGELGLKKKRTPIIIGSSSFKEEVSKFFEQFEQNKNKNSENSVKIVPGTFN